MHYCIILYYNSALSREPSQGRGVATPAICMYVCICIHIYIYICIHTHTYTYIHTCI